MTNLEESSINSIEYKYVLKLYVNNENEEFYEKYVKSVNSHNDSLIHNSHPDSGFDLYSPCKIETKERTIKVSMDVKAAMYMVDPSGQLIPCVYYLYPRSSIYKTPFRLANIVGIIDSGYRGHLGCVLDVFDYSDKKESICSIFTRLVQICSPTLEPFKIILVSHDSQLGETERGTGGFGSTGSN